ncbi:MAG: DNA polymerase III subunit gamma/tau [Elusimicrobia bacterium]|nr:DNA polymerase III subunit gamma/tau [Elusimicrobiota bacterium]
MTTSKNSRSLTLKYRPSFFKDMVGQEAVWRSLSNAVTAGRLHQAYLFHGPRGSGKTSMARIFARLLNCQKRPSQAPAEPCGKCPACLEIAEGRCLDVLEIDAASHTQVDHIREVVIDTINLSPARDPYRVFIIDEVHMLSMASFNAMLKTLEEPPPHVLFVLATTELNKVPATVVSRTQSFPFRALSIEEITGRLRQISGSEKIKASDEAIREIAGAATGSLRDALSILEQLVSLTEASGGAIDKKDLVELLGFVEDSVLEDIVESLALGPDFEKAKKLLENELYRQGHSPAQLLGSLFRKLSEKLLKEFAAGRPAPQRFEGGDTASSGGRSDALRRRLFALSEHVLKLQGDLRWAVDPILACEVGLLGFLLKQVDFRTEAREIKEDKAEMTAETVKTSPPKADPPPAEDFRLQTSDLRLKTSGLKPQASSFLPKPAPVQPSASTTNDPKERFAKFLDAVKAENLDIYLDGAELLPAGNEKDSYEMLLLNAACQAGMENNKDKIMPAWRTVFGQSKLKYVVRRSEGAAASKTPAPFVPEKNPGSSSEEVPEDIKRIAQVFGGKIKRFKQRD